MHISFHGAAKTVTGSKHIISLSDGRRILLDCGMFQGLGPETDALNSSFGFDPAGISVLLLSHAHIDHSGLIPKLIKEGFTGRIYCTAATAELAEILLHDSAEIQTYDFNHHETGRQEQTLAAGPLYDHQDVMASFAHVEAVPYDKWFSPLENVRVIFTNNGHLIGSAAISISITEDGKETNILYTGDIGKYRSVFLQSPAEVPVADHIIMESTYGDRHHDLSFNALDTLHDWINKTCIKKEGKLIIPAFSVGRTQEVLYLLNQLELERRLPGVNIFVDSPLSQKATTTLKKYHDLYNERFSEILKVDDDPFLFNGLKFIDHIDDSRKLKETDKPCIIISASGTGDAGRVRHHIAQCVSDAKNSILMVGYCGNRSLGGRLLHGDKQVDIYGTLHDVKADIGCISGFSAHGDATDLLQFVNGHTPEKVSNIYLVHGEYETQQGFKSRLEQKGFAQVHIPRQHEHFIPGKRLSKTP